MSPINPPTLGIKPGIQNTQARLYAEGMTTYQKGRYTEAEQVFAQLLAVNPKHADAWHMRGDCCLRLARLDEAETFIRNALAIRQDAGFYTGLGLVLARVNKIDAAIAAYRESLALNPGNAQACNNLGNQFLRKGEWAEAEALYRQATQLAPDDALAWANLGLLLATRRHYDEAEQALRKSLALNPSLSRTGAGKTLGAVLSQKPGCAAEAARFLTATGDWGRLAENLRMRAAWEQLAQADAGHIHSINDGRGDTVAPLSPLNMPALTPALQRRAARQFAGVEFAAALQCPPLVNTVARHGPLRIGYLSADFYNHATMHLLAGVLEAHDTARFDIHLLALNPPIRDSYAPRIAALPGTFHDLSQVSDPEAAQRIAQIAPHLLIDLKGYTINYRLNITARRPAPVIVNWLGFPGTLGHERLADYIIGDPIVTPPDHAPDFSETLALMPHCYQPNDRTRPLGAPVSRAEEGLPESGFVFCSFNQYFKINPSTFDIWCRLLAATPGSVLWLLYDDRHPEGPINLRREAGQRGIAANRLVFAQRKPLAEHLARLRLADLALDTFPYTSHTTASDALWAGVPLLTRIGQTFASRVAASLLTTHGFPELIVQDDEAYFKLALSLVKQPERLQQLRQKLDAARLSSPLFDTTRFTRDLERLYEAIWQQHSLPRHERLPLILKATP